VGIPLEDFEDEDKIGIRLPHDATQIEEWWRKNRSLSLALRKAGWKFESFDGGKEILFFIRERPWG
jgi:hypothetical protein